MHINEASVTQLLEELRIRFADDEEASADDKLPVPFPQDDATDEMKEINLMVAQSFHSPLEFNTRNRINVFAAPVKGDTENVYMGLYGWTETGGFQYFVAVVDFNTAGNAGEEFRLAAKSVMLISNIVNGRHGVAEKDTVHAAELTIAVEGEDCGEPDCRLHGKGGLADKAREFLRESPDTDPVLKSTLGFGQYL